MFIRAFIVSLLAFCAFCPNAAADLASGQKPAPAPIENVLTDYFGVKISDPYRWMESGLTDKRFEEYLKAQGNYTRDVLASLGKSREQMLARIRELDTAIPILRYWQRAGERTFYLETSTDSLNTCLMMKDGKGKVKTLLDPRNMAKKGQHSSIDYFTPSYDGKYVVIGVSLGGSEDSTISIIDVDNGRVLPEKITRGQYAFPIWRADSKSFYYSRLQELPEGAPKTAIYENEKVYLHLLEREPDKDPAVFGAGLNETLDLPKYGFVGIATDLDCPYVLGFHSSGTTDHQTVYLAKQDAANDAYTRWRQIISKEDKLATQAQSNLALHGKIAYFLSEKDAPNRKLLSIDLEHPEVNPAAVVEASDRILLGIYCAKDALYLTSRQGVNYFLQRLPLTAGAKLEDIELPFKGAISNLDASAAIEGVMFRLESWTESGQAFIYSPQSKKVENTGLVKQHPADFSKIEAREVTARSADGTMVPVSIICSKDLRLDGSHPCIEVGYGAYGISVEPNYDPAMLSWLELNGVIAIVHPRGGGELGESWHEAGKKKTKQHTIDDMIAAAEYLIENKYTSSAKLAIKGTSAGGIACGGAITQRPELFAVAIDNVGMTDMLRFQYTQGGEANIPEFGDVTKKDEFEYLYAMSAYHHVKDNVKYPAVMGITGANDPRVPSWIIAKMVARLQAASTSNRPVLLRVDFDAGHGIGSNRSQRQKQMADERSFILWQTGDAAFAPEVGDEFER